MATTLVVQTEGEFVENANTYLSVVASDALATKYGLTAWTSASGDKTTPLFLATQFLETTYGPNFKGYLTEDLQPLSFPRTEFQKNTGQTVLEGYIPQELQLAQVKL